MQLVGGDECRWLIFLIISYLISKMYAWFSIDTYFDRVWISICKQQCHELGNFTTIEKDQPRNQCVIILVCYPMVLCSHSYPCLRLPVCLLTCQLNCGDNSIFRCEHIVCIWIRHFVYKGKLSLEFLLGSKGNNQLLITTNKLAIFRYKRFKISAHMLSLPILYIYRFYMLFIHISKLIGLNETKRNLCHHSSCSTG